jgi:thymidylate synthase (FAD)
MKVVEPKVELLWITPEGAKEIEKAARVCYRSEEKMGDGSAAKMVKMLIGLGHEAMIEHGVASFRIVTDRGISHEIVRHRLASYAQESTRYCKYREGIKVIRPSGMDQYQEAVWRDAVLLAETRYWEMLQEGAKAEVARSVLPTCVATVLVMTANFREWRHFLKLRGSAKAHPDIRRIAEMIRWILVKECGEVFWDFTESLV